MKHFLLMFLYAALVGLVFGTIGKNEHASRLRYGLKVFIEFIGVGFVIAWVLYIIG